MKAEIYWITEAPVRIGILPRPRGGDWLDDEIASLAAQGVDILVSLLTQEEAADLELVDEAASCKANGVTFISFPIEDRGIPDERRAVRALIDELCEVLEQKKGVAIHCRAGIGRSSMIAALVLAAIDVPIDDTFRMIASARGCEVPDTPQQREWVLRFQNSRDD